MRRVEFEQWARQERDAVAWLPDARDRGVSERSWQRWTGFWHPVAGVRGAHHLEARPTPESRLRSALLAVPDAVLAGRSALWAHGLVDRPWPLQVVVGHDLRHRSMATVSVRRSRTLRPEDREDVGRWPATSVARAVMDLAPPLGRSALLGLVIDLVRLGALRVEDLVRRLEASPTAEAATRLLEVVAELDDVSPDSVFEWAVRRDLVAAGLCPSPGPRDVATRGGVVSCDLVFAAARVAVECDGGSHLEPAQADRDAHKANVLADAGWLLFRVRYAPWRADPAGVLAPIVRAVRARMLPSSTLGA